MLYFRPITLSALHDSYLKARAAADPVWASSMGLHEHDALLTLVDDDSVARRRSVLADALARLETAGGDPIDRQVFEMELTSALYELDRWDARRMCPGLPLEAASTIHTMLIKDYAPFSERVRNAAARLGELPGVIADVRRLLDRPPGLWTRMALDDLAGMEAFLEELAALADDPAFGAAARSAAGDYSAYAGFLREEVLPRSEGAFAVGTDAYEKLMLLNHGLPLKASALLEIGRAELDRTFAEMEALAGRGRVAEAVDRAKGRHPTAEDLREAYARETERARRFVLERDLAEIPADAPLVLIDTPPFMRSTVPYAAYSPPAPMDGSRTGHFYVTPAEDEERLRGHSFADIENTVLHEAYPGHHLQLVYAKRVSSTIRRCAESPTLAEGWGLYCEELGHETGYYSSDEARLLALNWRLHRAARVILDVSLHTRGLAVGEAVDFLVERIHLQRPQAEASVNAYTRHPTYFMSYLVGMREIQRVREAARARWGNGFTLRRFHEGVLEAGNIPVGLLHDALLSGG